VIDGATRDVDEIETMSLPVFARGVNPAGPTKTGPGTVGVPVACGNVVCNPGDVIIGDRDGIIVISRDDLVPYAERIVEQEAFESTLRSKIRESVQKRA
jgi:regulator of RNase E activity RraA